MAKADRRIRPAATLSAPGGHALAITRTFNAPVAAVFAAWTQADRVRQWLGPYGVQASLFESDPHPGGAWRARMRAPDGREMGQRGFVLELSAPLRFAFTQRWDDGDGPETIVTIDLAQQEGRTTMRFHQGDFDTAEARDDHEDGWSQSFDKLESYLARTEA